MEQLSRTQPNLFECAEALRHLQDDDKDLCSKYAANGCQLKRVAVVDGQGSRRPPEICLVYAQMSNFQLSSDKTTSTVTNTRYARSGTRVYATRDEHGNRL